jgi:hypothetical protein
VVGHGSWFGFSRLGSWYATEMASYDLTLSPSHPFWVNDSRPRLGLKLLILIPEWVRWSKYTLESLVVLGCRLGRLGSHPRSGGQIGSSVACSAPSAGPPPMRPTAKGWAIPPWPLVWTCHCAPQKIQSLPHFLSARWRRQPRPSRNPSKQRLSRHFDVFP